jgi:hypothetical protein
VLEVMDTPVITSEGKRIYDIDGRADALCLAYYGTV